MNLNYLLILFIIINECFSYNILAVFPYNGRSHHNLFSTLIEELASRDHFVTVVNYFPMKKLPTLRQISLKSDADATEYDVVSVDDTLKNTPSAFSNFYKAMDTARAFKSIANTNCEKLMSNKEIQEIIFSKAKYDVVIVEQFVTDCGLAIAYKLNAPIVGAAAHVLMPWTYSRLGAPNHPAYVPNHFFASETKPDLWDKIQSATINTGLNIYYKYVIQKNDHKIIHKVYEDVPDLEEIGKNISLILLNQYFPLTGSRLYGANVVEVGGLHVKNDTTTLNDLEMQRFIEEAKNDVIYISFGTVATNFPTTVIKEILNLIKNSPLSYLWKIDQIGNFNLPKNVLARKWFPQTAILCQPKVKAFVTHSGMLSSIEAMHCGVPIISIPLFGDQFANAASAVENGLGVAVDISSLDEGILNKALRTVLQESYQVRARNLSLLWRHRPVSPMDLAIFWIEYVAKHKGNVRLQPPTVSLSLYEFLMLDIIGIATCIFLSFYGVILMFMNIVRFFSRCLNKPMKTKKQ